MCLLHEEFLDQASSREPFVNIIVLPSDQQMKYAPFITSEECDRLEEIEHPDLKVLTAGGKRLHYANRAPCTRMPGPVVHTMPIN